MILGTALMGLGLAILLLDIYRANPQSTILPVLSLMALPRWLRAAMFAVVGLVFFVVGVVRFNRALLAPYMRPGKPVVQAVAHHRKIGRGPRVVAIGGGTGLATLLRGLKQHTANLTAIVSVADDGGSSGKLRRSLGMLPPGDLRNCLAALSDDEDLLTQLFQYRFVDVDGLEGHPFGNLLIAALSGVTGSFDRGVMEAGRVLAIHGQVVPSTLANVALLADKSPMLDAQAIRIEGESRIPSIPGRIRAVHLEPGQPPAFPEAIRSLLAAEMIVIGPGSLYTSVLPNLLVPDIAHAIRSSRAFKVYVCNIATQPGETDGYNCRQHLSAIDEHVGRGIADLMLVNDRIDSERFPRVSFVRPAEEGITTIPTYATDLIDDQRPWRHDSLKLADSLIRLLEERTGPLELSSGVRAEPAIGLS
jgi:uncharacterized cofD-like protein